MATDVSKSLKNLEITIPYALLRSWASLTTGQEILHYAKDYKDLTFDVHADRFSKQSVNIAFTRHHFSGDTIDFHVKTCNTVSHSKNYSERVGDAINNIMEDTALMNKVMKSLLDAKKISKSRAGILDVDDQDEEDDGVLHEDESDGLEQGEVEEERPQSNLTEASINQSSLLSTPGNSVDGISEALANSDGVAQAVAFSCWECGKSFIYQAAFTKHLKSQHDIDYQSNPTTQPKQEQICPVCSQSFWYSGSYKKHLKEKHDMEPDPNEIEIPMVEQFSMTNSKPAEKRPRGRPRKHPEKPAPKKVVINTATALIQKGNTSSVKPEKPPISNIPISVLVLKKSDDNYVTVDRTLTQTILGTQLMCTQCQAIFLETRAYALHMFASHNFAIKDETSSTDESDKPVYYCYKCEKTTTSKGGMEHHLKYQHQLHISLLETITIDSDYECLGCCKSFVHFVSYQKHMSKVHGEVITDPDLPAPDSPVAHHYSCETCESSFTRRDYLAKHITEWHPDSKQQAFVNAKNESYSYKTRSASKASALTVKASALTVNSVGAANDNTSDTKKESSENKMTTAALKSKIGDLFKSSKSTKSGGTVDDELSSIAAAAEAALGLQLETDNDYSDEEEGSEEDSEYEDENDELTDATGKGVVPNVEGATTKPELSTAPTPVTIMPRQKSNLPTIQPLIKHVVQQQPLPGVRHQMLSSTRPPQVATLGPAVRHHVQQFTSPPAVRHHVQQSTSGPTIRHHVLPSTSVVPGVVQHPGVATQQAMPTIRLQSGKIMQLASGHVVPERPVSSAVTSQGEPVSTGTTRFITRQIAPTQLQPQNVSSIQPQYVQLANTSVPLKIGAGSQPLTVLPQSSNIGQVIFSSSVPSAGQNSTQVMSSASQPPTQLYSVVQSSQPAQGITSMPGQSSNHSQVIPVVQGQRQQANQVMTTVYSQGQPPAQLMHTVQVQNSQQVMVVPSTSLPQTYIATVPPQVAPNNSLSTKVTSVYPSTYNTGADGVPGVPQDDSEGHQTIEAIEDYKFGLEVRSDDDDEVEEIVEDIYQCDMCGGAFFALADLGEHKQIVHNVGVGGAGEAPQAKRLKIDFKND